MLLFLQQEDEEGINPLIKVWNFDKVNFKQSFLVLTNSGLFLKNDIIILKYFWMITENGRLLDQGWIGTDLTVRIESDSVM